MPDDLDDLWSSHQATLELLIESLSVAPESIVPYVGAGLSQEYGFPGWTKFLKIEAQAAGVGLEIDEHLSRGRYEEAAEVLAQTLGPRLFQDHIVEHFDKAVPARQDSAVRALTSLGTRFVATTCYEDVLRAEFELCGRGFDDVVSGPQLSRVWEAFDRHALWKIHGDVKELRDRVLTFKEYAALYGAAEGFLATSPLPTLLIRLFTPGGLLFLGCSLDGDRPLMVLEQTAKAYGGLLRNFAVVEANPDLDQQRERSLRLSRLGISPIWYPPGRHDLIAPLLRRIGSDAQTRRLAKTADSPVLFDGDDPRLTHLHGLYGRDEQVGRILNRVADPRGALPRATCVVGPPGVGKSEICAEALRRLIAHGHTIYFLDAFQAGGVPALLDRLTSATGSDSRTDLLVKLRRLPGVLYVNNAEDILSDDDAVELLTEIASIPDCHVLLSSRETFEGRAANLSISPLDPSSAYVLFEQELLASDDQFRIDRTEDVDAFLRDELGYLPLSLVLVGAQAYRYGSLTELIAAWHEIGVALGELARGPRTSLTSLETSIQFSYRAAQADNPNATNMWALISMFPFGLHSTTALFGKNPETEAAVRTLRHLNLIQFEGAIVHMLPPLRRFMLDRVRRTPNVLEPLLSVLHDYYVDLGVAANQTFSTDHPGEALNDLLRNLDNIDFFYQITPRNDKWLPKLNEVSNVLLNFWDWRPLLGLKILRELGPLQESSGLDEDLCFSLPYRARLELRVGNPLEAQALARRAVDFARSLHTESGLASALAALGEILEVTGHSQEALQTYEQGLRACPEGLEDALRARLLMSRGITAKALREDGAVESLEEALHLYEIAHDRIGVANVKHALAEAFTESEPDKATNLLDEAWDVFDQWQNLNGKIHILLTRGDIARRRANPDLAVSSYGEAFRLSREPCPPAAG